ncbi:MAG: TSUP family transporter [Rhodospirillales bacterium]|nr:TSUP family transporter [Rhodospirillales bacterium]
MDYLVIAATAFLVSCLTLFSGFGLGTVLMPAFALFFPVPVAVAATAAVHLANNLFKLALVGRRADWRMVARFGLPAALAAIAGASALMLFSDLPTIATYRLGERIHEVTPVKAVIGLLIVAFAALDLCPPFRGSALPPRFIVLGGLLSGFFGGLSGNQGALRSAFLIKAGLDKDAFVGTGVVSTAIVDTVRLAVYGLSFYTMKWAVMETDIAGPVVAAVVAAFLGAYLGSRLLKKVTLRFVRIVVALTMTAVGMALVGGLA